MSGSHISRVEKTVERCRRVGWEVLRRKDFYLVRAPGGEQLSLHLTPSDSDTPKIVNGRLRSMGLERAEREMDAKEERERRAVIAADARKAAVKTAQVVKQARASKAVRAAAGEYAVEEFDPAWVLRAHPQPAVRKMLIDPVAADKMLGHNRRNRRIKKAHRNYLTSAMSQGRFLFTHQGVAFDTNTDLIDGQHRLHAIVDSGEAQVMFVFVGIDPAAFTIIDTHAVRSSSDALGLVGGINVSNLGAVIRQAFLYLRVDPGLWSVFKVDNEQVADIYQKDRELLDFVVREAANARQQKRGLPTSALGAVAYCALKRGATRDDVIQWFYGFKTGEDLHGGHSTLALRRLADRYSDMTGRPHKNVVFGQVLVAWNAYIEGRNLNSLTRRADDPMPPISVRK